MAAGTTYEPIATTTITGSPSSYTFSSIPQTYTDIYYVIYTPSISSVNTNMTFNGDTTTKYSWVQLYGDGTSVGTSSAANIAYMLSGISDGTAAIHGHIMGYSNTTTFKTMIVRGGGNRYVDIDVNMWRNTAAITSITMTASWVAGSVLTIYGIKAA